MVATRELLRKTDSDFRPNYQPENQESILLDALNNARQMVDVDSPSSNKIETLIAIGSDLFRLYDTPLANNSEDINQSLKSIITSIRLVIAKIDSLDYKKQEKARQHLFDWRVLLTNFINQNRITGSSVEEAQGVIEEISNLFKIRAAEVDQPEKSQDKDSLINSAQVFLQLFPDNYMSTEIEAKVDTIRNLENTQLKQRLLKDLNSLLAEAFRSLTDWQKVVFRKKANIQERDFGG